MAGPNALFDLYYNADEQFLLNGLVEESILINGLGCLYVPRREYHIDPLLTEDSQKFYDTTYLTTFYIKNVEGFQSQRDLISKFGLEIRDQITLTASDTIFQEDVGRHEGFIRPREGDLVYFPLNKKVFQIDFVEKFNMYYPLGSTPSYDLTVSLYEYSGESFRTGYPDIDEYSLSSENIFDWSVLAENGSIISLEDGSSLAQEGFAPTNIDVFDQTDVIQNEGTEILDWSKKDPFSSGGVY